MADFVVGGRLGLKDEGATQTVSNFKKELREASKNLVDVQNKFGATSAEALQAAKRVAQLKDSIQEAKEVADLFDPGAKFQVFGNVLRTVAGSFSALTGAVALFGEESEEVEKAILKVQAALALTEGLNTIMDAGKDFQRLGAFLKGGFTNALGAVKGAFVGLRGAIIATGLGALAVGIGLLIANFDKVKQVVLNLFPGLNQLGKIFGDLIQKVTDFVGITSEADRALESFNKQTEESNSAIDRKIKLLQAQGSKETEIYALQKQRLDNEEKAIRQAFRTNKELTEDQQKRFKEIQTEREVLDIQESRRIAEKAKSDSDKIRQANERAAEQSKAAREKREAERKAQEEKDLQSQNDFLSAQRKLNEKSREEEKDDITEWQEWFDEQEAARKEKQLQDDLDAGKRAEENLAIQVKNEQEAAKAAQESAAARVAAYNSVGEALGALSQLIGQETVAGKALAVAQAVINTWLGVTEVLRAKSILPEPLGTIAKVANVATIVAAGLNAVKNIAKTPIPGRGGGGGGAAAGGLTVGAPVQARPQVTNTRLDQQSINQIGNAASRSYVLETDVTNNQERVKRLNRAARLG